MVRVMMVVPQYPYPVVGGLERQAHELSKALVRRGMSVQVLSGKIDSSQPTFELVEGVPVNRIEWVHWKPRRFVQAPFDIFRFLWKLRSTYDVIHLHQHSWFGLYVIVLANLLRKPVLTKLPNVGVHGIPGLRSQPLGRLRLAILKKSSGMVAMSHESVSELLNVGFPRTNILCVPNGITVRPDSNGHDAHDTLCRVVFVGRLAEEKRLGSLLDAWSRVVRQSDFAARLELWGDGPLRGALRAQAEQLGIMPSVAFLGHVDQVRDRLRAVDIFVLPSSEEGNSNAVLEAMDAGLPIVATAVGGTPMQVGPEGASLLFDVGDSKALADRLIALIENPILRREYGKAMRRRAERIFSIDNVAETYHKAYARLVGTVSGHLSACGVLPE